MRKYISLDWLVEHYFAEDVDFYGKYVREDLLSEKTPTIEVREDAISREWVKGICEAMLDEEMLGHMLGYIEDAPSVIPKAKEGEWIERALDFVAELIDYIAEYPDDDYMTMECLCRKLHKHGLIERKDGEWTCNSIEKVDTPQIEWVYNKREKLWYPYSNGEPLFKTENSQESPCTNCYWKEVIPCCCCMEFIAWKRKTVADERSRR